MARRNYVLNHKRVTHNERYNNFMIQPNLIYEDEILFVYSKNGVEIQKKIPTKEVMRLIVKDKAFFKYDYEINRSLYKGHAYVIPADSIFNYKA